MPKFDTSAASRTSHSTRHRLRPAGPIRSAPAARPPVPRAGAILALVVTTQLLIVLDASIVNLSLTDLRQDLGVSSATLAWVVNAYALTFGGLLLLGGRLGDGLGRRRVFVAGVALFALAALAGGIASEPAILIAARATQGIGAAIAAPSGLAILLATFPEGEGRTKALGLFMAMSAAGGAIGLLIGGALTSGFSWRAAFLVNVPVGLAIVAAAIRLLPAFPGVRARFDFAGAMTGTLGVGSLVFAFIRTGEEGWGETTGTAAFAAAALLLTTFVAIEGRIERPLLPPRLFAKSERGAAYAAMGLTTASMFAISFFLPQYLQVVLGFSPIVAGVAFLPMPVLIFVGSNLAAGLVARTSPRAMALAGFSSLTAAGVWLTQLTETTGYFPGVFAPLTLVGTAGALLFLPLSMLILGDVPDEDSGAASGAMQATQQIGGALGVAVLASIFGAVAGTMGDPATFSAGVSDAFIAVAGFAVAAIVLVLLFVGRDRDQA